MASSYNETTDSSSLFDASNNPAHHPHHLTLGSVAASFREEDYEPAPPGVDQRLWEEMIRREKRNAGGQQQQSRGNETSEIEYSTGEYYEGQSRSQGGGGGGEEEEEQSSRRRYQNDSISQSQSQSQSQFYEDDEPSRSTEPSGDRTELLSERLPRGGEGDSTLELDESGMTGGDSALLRRATANATTKRRTGAGSTGNLGNGQNMTLREQEKVIDELKKDNFSLKLKLHFYEQRLEKLAPSSVEQALRENIQLKVEFQTLRTELKRYKKLLVEGDRALKGVTEERDELMSQARRGKGGRVSTTTTRDKEWEKEVKSVKEERDRWENKARELQRLLKERGDVDDLQAQLEDALAESDDLKRHLQNATDELEDLRDEVGGLRRELADQADQSIGGSITGDRTRGLIRREVEKLEQDNATLRSQLTAQLTMLSTRHDEKDALREQVEQLKQDLIVVENELESATRRIERRDGKRTCEGGGEMSREELERELDTYRDRSTSLSLELEETKSKLDEKEREIEELINELDEKDHELQDVAQRVDEEWREEVEGARQAEKEAKEAFEERERDVQELADKVEQLAQEVSDRKAELATSDEEIDALTHDLQKLGAQIFTLEEELDSKDQQVSDLENELGSIEKELEDKQSVHEQVVVALKDKLATTKSTLSQVTIQHESATTESTFLRSKIEDIALHNAKLVEQNRKDEEEKSRLQKEAEEIMEALKKEEDERDAEEERYRREGDRMKREIEELEEDLRSFQNEVKQLKSLVSTREADLESLESALNSLRRQGENANTDKFALDLEIDRSRRDLARVEKEVREARGELEEKIKRTRELELQVANLESDNRELTAQVASQTQTRLALADKHDLSRKTLRETQTELSSARDRLRLLEDQLATDHRALSKTENGYRDMVNERNTLLLTVYEYMERIASADKRGAMSSPSLRDSPKPFSDFGAFHIRLLDRLKAVSLVQSSFKRRVDQVERSFTDQLSSMKKQQDARMKQIDQFEVGLKAATENQKQWRTRVQQRTLELQQARKTVSDLQEELLQLRRSPAPGGSPSTPRSPNSSAEASLQTKLSSAQNRAATLERRLSATQAQLKDAEEKLAETREKIGTAEGKWEARFRELEARCRAAEEKVKRERQGAKERVQELQSIIKSLESQVQGAHHRQERVDQLDRVLQQQQQTQ
ncbi:uncharacterized protein JCM6883_001440 [Sporobolomyces salmoneus]|uniref:uncharacterized protein n=1 Tax=Sporobolomyces salmoneus TaxID=183962 RepID=UPI00317FF4FF